MASAACHAYQRVIASVDFRLCPVRRLIKDTTGAGSYPQPPLAVVDGKGYVANMERVDDAPLCQGWLPSVCLVGKDGFQQMSLFGEEEKEKQKNLDKALDQIRSKYGNNSVMRAGIGVFRGDRRKD